MDTLNFNEVANSNQATPVVIRRIWPNLRSSKNQATIQFYQKKATGMSGPGGLVGIFQNAPGLTSTATAIQSIHMDKLAELGLPTEVDYTDGEAPVANSVLGVQVNIEITDSFNSNPFSDSHNPKVNPTNGDVITINGRDVYRHTELVAGEAQDQIISSVSVEADVVREYTRGMAAQLAAQKGTTATVKQSESTLADTV